MNSEYSMKVALLPGGDAETVKYTVELPAGLPPHDWPQAAPLYLAIARGTLYTHGWTGVAWCCYVTRTETDYYGKVYDASRSIGGEYPNGAPLDGHTFTHLSNKAYWNREKAREAAEYAEWMTQDGLNPDGTARNL